MECQTGLQHSALTAVYMSSIICEHARYCLRVDEHILAYRAPLLHCLNFLSRSGYLGRLLLSSSHSDGGTHKVLLLTPMILHTLNL